MNANSITHYALATIPVTLVAVTRKVVRERAVILAISVGRSELEVSKADWDQAKRELLGAQNTKQMESSGISVIIKLT